MDIANQRRLLYATAGLLLIGTAGTVYWATAEIDSTAIRPTAPTTREKPDNAEDASVASQQHSVDLAISLRGPLYDPPPKPPAKPKPVVRDVPVAKPPPKPRLNLTLVGTLIDRDQSLAIIADGTGNFDVKGVGEALELTPEGVRIGSIDSDQITLEFQGNESTIRLEESAKSSSNATSRRQNNRRRKP